MSVSSETVNYQKKEYIPSEYKFTKLYPQVNTLTDGTTLSDSSAQVEFELPANVYNLARSSLNLTITPTAATGAKVNTLFRDCLAGFQRLELYTRGNVYLCDIPYVAEYTKQVLKPETKWSEYETHDRNSDLLVRCNNITSIGGTTSYVSIKVKNGATPAVVSNAFVSIDNKFDTTTGLEVLNTEAKSSAYAYLNETLYPEAQRYGYTSVDVPYDETQYRAVGATADSETPVLNLKIRLGDLKQTIFAIDKSLPFKEVLLMRITFNPIANWGYVSESRTASSTPTAIAEDITLSNIFLYLANEKNPAIIAELMSEVDGKGLSIPIPYPFVYKSTATAATSQNLSYRLNLGHGLRLLKSYHGIYDATEAQTTRYELSNTAHTKLVSFYTLLNNERRQEFDLQTADGDDYMLLKEYLRGSVIQSRNMYDYNWVWIENFANNKNDESGNLLMGMPLDKEVKYDIYMTTANSALRHCTVFIFQRMLSISSAGITSQ
jgi:hypothetical protein